MSYGFYRGGLAEAEREAASRRQNERSRQGLENLDLAPFRRKTEEAQAPAIAVGTQAERDVGAIVAMLRSRAGSAGNGYARAKAAAMPVLLGRIATAMAARDEMPFALAERAAQRTAEALLERVGGDFDGAGRLPRGPASDAVQVARMEPFPQHIDQSQQGFNDWTTEDYARRYGPDPEPTFFEKYIVPIFRFFSFQREPTEEELRQRLPGGMGGPRK